MKLTYFITTGDGIGGTERAAFTQANSFAEHGHDVRVLSVYRETGRPVFALHPDVTLTYLVDLPRPLAEAQVVEQAAELGGPSRLIPREWDNQFTAASDAAIRDALGDLDSDVLVTTTPALTALASDFAPPSIVVVQQEHRSTAGRDAASFAPIAAYAPRIDCLVSLTDRSTAWLGERLGETAPLLETIPNSIPDVYYPRADLDSRIVIAAGRFVSGKNFTDLITAFGLASDLVPGWRLRIYGQGPGEARLRGRIRTLHLEDSVELIPAVPDMLSEWSKGAVFAMSSLSEGLPLVMLEAMAAGLPLVGYDCDTGPSEIIDDGVNGLLVPLKDVGALGQALATLMADGELRESYGQAGLSRVDQFSPEHVYEQWLNLFSELLEASGPRGERAVKRAAQARAVAPSGEADGVEPDPADGPDEGDLEQGDSLSVLPLSELRPESVTARALRYVADTLDQASIPYFWVPGYSGTQETLAVPAELAEDVMDALEARPRPGMEVLPLRGTSRLTTAPWRLTDHRPSSPLYRSADALRVYERAIDTTGSVAVAHEFGCDIEFWAETEGQLRAPRHNRAIDLVSATDLGRLEPRTVRGVEVPTVPLLSTATLWHEPDFPIDVVYTWVDDTDPTWAERRALASGTDLSAWHAESTSSARFRNRDELRYSLRSLATYAPWVRHIYLVTDAQRPAWLVDGPGLTVVDHRELFPEPAALPVFNSHAIESVLHRIDGLSEHYLYLNDDVLLARPQAPSHYFDANGTAKFFLSPVKINDLGASAPPHLGAAMNNRMLLERDFGKTITQGVLHTPYALRRSVGFEIEERYPEEWQRTTRSVFRSSSDLSIPSSLAHYLGYFTGRSRPGSIKYRYIGLGNPNLERVMLQALRSVSTDVIALGDPPDGVEDPETVDQMVGSFLETLLPWATPHEGHAT